jgi:hypothetical protein
MVDRSQEWGFPVLSDYIAGGGALIKLSAAPPGLSSAPQEEPANVLIFAAGARSPPVRLPAFRVKPAT